MTSRSLLLLVLGFLILQISAVHNAPFDGELEVLIADDFGTGTHRYEVYLHLEHNFWRIRLNPMSFGPALPTLRTSMQARIWLDNTSSEHNKRNADESLSQHVAGIYDKTLTYDVSHFELVRKLNRKTKRQISPSLSAIS